MLWSAAPVDRYDTKANVRNPATKASPMPSMKLNVSLWNILSRFNTLDRLELF